MSPHSCCCWAGEGAVLPARTASPPASEGAPSEVGEEGGGQRGGGGCSGPWQHPASGGRGGEAPPPAGPPEAAGGGGAVLGSQGRVAPRQVLRGGGRGVGPVPRRRRRRRQRRLLLWAGGGGRAGAVHDEAEHAGPAEEAVPAPGRRRLRGRLGRGPAGQPEERAAAAAPAAAAKPLLARAVTRLLREKVAHIEGPEAGDRDGAWEARRVGSRQRGRPLAGSGSGSGSGAAGRPRRTRSHGHTRAAGVGVRWGRLGARRGYMLCPEGPGERGARAWGRDGETEPAGWAAGPSLTHRLSPSLRRRRGERGVPLGPF